ncbi:MAG TPA: S8 family serine peptidase [Nitriliruptorales bacterium]|nr:S8 family serine peptidase [Nitriliruptorales bacterium]
MKVHVAALAAFLCLFTLASAQAQPNDPYYPQQWGLQRIGAPEAWNVTRGEGIVVAVIDSGVDLTHPDLMESFARRPDGRVLGHDFVDDDDDPFDVHGHGTMVAGTIAARTSNGSGVASVAPQARIMPVRVLDGEAGGTSDDVDAAVRWAVDHGAHVINLSLEVAREPGSSTMPLVAGIDAPDAAVRYAWERGVAVVAAAGNDSDESNDYSADSPVLLVGATDRQDQPATFSDSGRPDAIMAPGVDIVSTWCDPCGPAPRHTIGQSEGTSYAAPHVAGTLALLRATGLTAQQAVQRVRDTAVDLDPPGPDARTGHGRLDTAAALAARPAPSAPVAQPPPPPPSSSRAHTAAATRAPAAPRSPARAGTVASTPPSSPTASPTASPTPSPTPETTTPEGHDRSPANELSSPATAAAPPVERDGPGGWAVLAAVLLAVNLIGLIVASGARRRHRLRGGP